MKRQNYSRLLWMAAVVLTAGLMTFSACSKDDEPEKKPTPENPQNPQNPQNPEDPKQPSTVAVTGVALNKTSLTLDVDAKEALSASILPENATEKGVTWKSNAEAIATVSANGEVTAVSKGMATITVTTKDGSKTATCTVNVNEKEVPLPALEVSISGKISHTTHTPGQTGTVTFNRFPATVAEFKQVREKIGEEPHGAVALQLMAYEMYRRDKDIGAECITLNNTVNNVNPAISRLKELFGKDAYYARPYQIAAFLKGATPENGYNPTKPYTVEVKVNSAREYQTSSDYQATVLYLDVLTKGKDQGTETLYVLKTKRPGEPGDGKFFIINNSPGLYSQVKEVSFENPFKGLD